MKKMIFLILPEKGHINPYIGPAQALSEQGYDVSVASVGDISKQIQRAGLRFDDSLVAQKAPAQPMRGQELVQLIQDPLAMRAWVQSLLLGVQDEDVQKHVQWIRTNKPDVLVIDPLAYTGVIAAEITQTKWVSMSNSLNPILEDDVQSDLLETLNIIYAAREKLFAKYGLQMKFKGCDAISPHLTIAFCTEEFVGQREHSVKMVGPSLPLKLRGDEEAFVGDDSRPVIYASFGSQIYYWPEIFEKLIQATQGLPYRLVLSVGDLSQSMSVPEHVSVYSYASQLEVLKKTELFITHGGANSVMEAISTNTPIWITPMCNDQFHQAHYVQKSGIGLVQDIRQLSVDEIRKSLLKILNDAEIKKNMKRVSASYQVDGSRLSAGLIGEIL